MAKNYIDNLAEEASEGLREKAEQGMWPSYSPLGYATWSVRTAAMGSSPTRSERRW